MAMARQVTHHRTPESRPWWPKCWPIEVRVLHAEQRADLQQFWTGAMEAAVANLVPRGGKAIVLESGKFSERGGKSARHLVSGSSVQGAWGRALRGCRGRPPARTASRCRGRVQHLVGNQHRRGPRHRGDRPRGRPEQRSVGGRWHQRRRGDGMSHRCLGHRRAGGRAPKRRDDAAGAGLPCRQSGRLEADRVDLAAHVLLRSSGVSQGPGGPDTPYTPAIPLVKALAESLRTIERRESKTSAARTKVLAGPPGRESRPWG